VRKDDYPNSNSEEEKAGCLAIEIRDPEERADQASDFIKELESSIAEFDKDIFKYENLTGKINESVKDIDDKITVMEKSIKADESGIEVLTQQSISLAAQLNKIEPEFESIQKAYSCIDDIKIENADIHSILAKVGKRMEKLKSSKELLEQHNRKLQNKAEFSNAK